METVVSVITPAFNAAGRLRDCVASIRSQSFGNWEHLVVDDGSTDATWALAQELHSQDARLRTIQQANAGPGAARNAAMKAASGRYFAFLDADDRATPHRLATQVAFLDEHPGVHVLGGAIVKVILTTVPGYRLHQWDGDLNGSAPIGFVAMSTPRSVRATLDRVPYIAPAGAQNAAGVTIDPDVSLPMANGARPAATAAAEPLEDPPDQRERSHGFSPGPVSEAAA